ncbi:MAG: helix-turn-helix domain-containing protein [Chitinivibrionales bacterium]|nr:helix-turn-helix domain-containing protein [Chitinivibrionales bacterium]
MLESVRNIPKIVRIPSTCRERYLDLEGRQAGELRDLGVAFGGVSDLRPGYEIGSPHTNRIMVIATVSGEGFFRTPSVDWALDRDSLLVAPPVCGWTFGVQAHTWRIAWVYLRDTPRWSSVRAAGVRLERGWHAAGFERAMLGYLDSGGHAERAGLYARLVASHVHELLSPDSGAGSDSSTGAIDDILAQIRRSPGRPWTIDGIARYLHMSVSSMQRRVKRHYGTTIWQLVLRARMETAEQLLRRTDYPLKVIADRVGYADEFAFSTAFRRCVGMSPSEYRRDGSS